MVSSLEIGNVAHMYRQVQSRDNFMKVVSTELSKIHIGIRIDDFKNPELPGCH